MDKPLDISPWPPIALRTSPLLTAFYEMLPAAGSIWAEQERQAWLNAIAQSFAVIYRRPQP